MRMRPWALAAIVVAGAASTPAATWQQYEPEYFEVRTDVVTPHVAWAKPYYGGPVRALFVGPYGALRDTAELAQRLELQFDVVGMWACKEFQAAADRFRPLGSGPEHMEVQALEKLRQPHDVIVVGNVAWQSLPGWVASEILRQVENGTGLVLAYCTEGRSPALQQALDRARPVPANPAMNRARGAVVAGSRLVARRARVSPR